MTTTTDPGDPGVRTVRRPSDPGTRTPTLAFTGGDVLGLAAIGGGATAFGAILAALGRRRRQAASVADDASTD